MIDAITKEYSHGKNRIYGNLFAYYGSNIDGSDLNRLYVVMGQDSACAGPDWPKGLNPMDAVRRQEGNPQLLWTQHMVIDLTNVPDELHINSELVKWASHMETLMRLYRLHGAPMPEALHVQEVKYLEELDSVCRDITAPEKAKRDLQKRMKKFFKLETKTTGFMAKWHAFVRSDRWPGEKSKLAQLWAFMHRRNNVVPQQLLWYSTDKVVELFMSEKDYRRFADIIKRDHPDVTYAISKKSVRDEGLDKKTGDTLQRGVRRVSEDEYDDIKRERFATEGWDSVNGLKKSRFVSRSVYYKESDAPVVEGVYQGILCEFAKADSIQSIRSWHSYSLLNISEHSMDSFVAHAKSNGIPFAIDTKGVVCTPVAGEIHILYPTVCQNQIQACMADIVNNAIQYGHNNDRHNNLWIQRELVSLQQPPVNAVLQPGMETQQPMRDPEARFLDQMGPAKEPKLEERISEAVDKSNKQREAADGLQDKKKSITINDIQL